MRVPRAVAMATGALLALQVVAVGGVTAASPPLTITADMPSAVPIGHMWGYNDFFPRSLRVHQGDVIQFDIQGFHTGTLLPAGMSVKQDRATHPFLAPDTDDTVRNPNGSTHFSFQVGAAMPAPGGCGSLASPCTFDGTSIVSTGVSLAGPMPPTAIQVTAPVGKYSFLCRIHPFMQGTLKVVPADDPATTADQLARSVRAQVRSDRNKGWAAEKSAEHAARHANADGTSTWYMTAGSGSPDGRVAVNEMLPRTLSIHPGDKVVWRSRAVNEPHTITFPTDLQTDIVPMCEGPGGTDVPATPRVIPPTGPFDFACGLGPPDEIEFDGGNGVSHVTSPATVSDSGIVAARRAVRAFELPRSAADDDWKVSFKAATPGTYHYVCQIHDGMEGDIVVH